MPKLYATLAEFENTMKEIKRRSFMPAYLSLMNDGFGYLPLATRFPTIEQLIASPDWQQSFEARYEEKPSLILVTYTGVANGKRKVDTHIALIDASIYRNQPEQQ